MIERMIFSNPSRLIRLLLIYNFLWQSITATNTWTVPFVFDNLTSNSVAYMPLSNMNGSKSGAALVTLDLGSNFFAVGIESLKLIPNGLLPLNPLPKGSSIPFDIDTTSIVNASYGAGGFQARLATGRFVVNSTRSVEINFGAMINYQAPFPIGGPKNVIGILGLNYPYGPPYCINNAVPNITPNGRNCNPSQDAVQNVPLLQQLNASGAVSELTVMMTFQGSTLAMNRYGSLTLGSAYNKSCPTVALEPIYGIEYTQYYITRIPALLVNGQRLSFTEVELQGATYLSGCCENWFGGWIIDSGWLYTVLPYNVYMNTTSAMWTNYQQAGGKMTSSQWTQLVNIGLVSGNNCSIGADYCVTSLEDVPCVQLTSQELQQLPTIALQLYNSSNGETLYWNYPATNYMYQITPGCYQLGLTIGDGAIIGNLQMQGHVVFLDQANHIAQFYAIDNTGNIEINGNNNSSTLSRAHVVGLSFGLVALVWVLVYVFFYWKSKYSVKPANNTKNHVDAEHGQTDSGIVLNPVSNFSSKTSNH